MRSDIPERSKIQRQKAGWKDTCQRKKDVLRSDIPERSKIRQKAGRKDTCQEGCVEIRYTREK